MKANHCNLLYTLSSELTFAELFQAKLAIQKEASKTNHSAVASVAAQSTNHLLVTSRPQLSTPTKGKRHGRLSAISQKKNGFTSSHAFLLRFNRICRVISRVLSRVSSAFAARGVAGVALHVSSPRATLEVLSPRAAFEVSSARAGLEMSPRAMQTAISSKPVTETGGGWARRHKGEDFFLT